MSILSKHFNVEIDAIDVATTQMIRFNTGRNVTHRCILCYTGIHYDAFVLGTKDDHKIQFDQDDVGMFPLDETVPLTLAMEKAEAMKAAGLYTDQDGYLLQCSICQKVVVGNDEAAKHLMATGHSNFVEVKK